MNKDKDDRPVEVYAGTAMQANMLLSLLANAEIEAFLQDEFIGMIAPWQAAPGGAGAVRIFVANSDYEKAVQVVREFEENM